MIPLNSKQGLPPNAFLYVTLRSLIGAIVFILIGRLIQMAGDAPGACRGALCGMISGGQLAGLIYLFGGLLVVFAVLNFKWFSFVLTDRSITIDSGVLFRRSCTVRFDRIQDIDSIRDPLHMLLGLKSVAIWTASPDQRVGNANRPDGLIVLEAHTADWLSDYLSRPPNAGDSSAVNAPRPVGSLSSGRRSNSGLALILVVAATMILALTGFWKKPTVTAPAAENEPGAATSPNAARHPVRNHPVQMRAIESAAGAQVDLAGYTIACTARGSGVHGVGPCVELREAQRCGHEADFPSQPTQEPAELTIVNRSGQNVNFYWLDRSGSRALYAALPPGGRVRQQSRIGAHWLVSAQDGHCIGIFDAATMTLGIF